METKTLAFAMAMVMVLSAFTAVSVVSDETDGASVAQLETGDAWGMGGSITLDDVFAMVNEQMAGDPDYKDLTVDDLKEFVIAFADFFGYELKDFDIKASGDIWEMSEVVEKNSSGYVIDIDYISGIFLGISGSLTGMLPTDIEDLEDLFDGGIYLSDEEDDGEDGEFVNATVTLEEFGIDLYIDVSGKLYLDNNLDITALELNTEMNMSSAIKSNVNVDDEGKITYGDKIVTEKFTAGGSVYLNMTVIGDAMHVIPDAGETRWEQDLEVNVTTVGSVYSDLPFDMDDVSDGLNDSYTTDMETEFVVEVKNVDGKDVYYVIPCFDDVYGVEFSFAYPFEYTPYLEYLPDGMLVNGSYKLDAAGAKTVSDNIGKIRGDVSDVTENMKFKVQFMDDDDNIIPELTIENIAFGDTIKLPDYPKDAPRDEDDVFIGWESPGDVIWKESFPVRCNMILEAEFADSVDDVPGLDDFLNSDNVFWGTDLDNIVDKVIDNEILNNGKTVYIEVSDKDGNVLYSWKLQSGFGSSLGSDTMIMPEIKQSAVPDKTYLNEIVGDGKSVYLDFQASGTMPDKTTVSYYVGDRFSDGDKVSIYYDNTVKGAAEHSGTAVVVDGYVDIPLKHCSSYLLVASGSDAADESSSAIIVAAALVLVVVAAAVLLLARKKKNSA